MKLMTIIISTLLLAFSSTIAQEIKADVIVNMEQLEFEARTNVGNLERDLENYINNQRFTEIEWEGEAIPIQITIYLSGGASNRYSAKFLILSTRPIDGPGERQSVNVKLYDDKWSFEYGLGASLSYNPLRFDEITSFIDYYMLLVIGYDLDTWQELGGSEAFNAARRIVEMALNYNTSAFKNNSNPGELTKANLTSELTNMRFNEFRKLVFAYYVDGLDLLDTDKEQAMKNLEQIIYYMALFKKNKLVESSVMMNLFFETKAQEIATIFNGYQNEDVFYNLKYLDPSNATLYDDAKEGKIKY